MDDAGLEPLLQFVAARTGTRLSRQQRGRLEAELAQHASGNPASWLAHLQSREGAPALDQLLAVVSVHKTELFRDPPQLEALAQHVLQPLAAQARPLHLWSAGCSTGEELATLLILLAEAGAHPESTVLGTDLSAEALGRAQRLRFSPEALERVPPPLLGRYFRDGALCPPLPSRARFLQHNLVDAPYPFSLTPGGDSGSFDVIICRNVLIYFTPEAARATVERFVERLRPGGVLVLSTAEPLLDPVPGLTTLRLPGAFFYVRSDGVPIEPAPALLPRPVASKPLPRPLPSREPSPAAAPEEEAQRLFELVLEGDAPGEDHPQTEARLRQALYLSPRLAAARYLLGLLLERRGLPLEASAEYRRAFATLDAGQALSSAFFLNPERLAKACKVALQRCALPGAGSPPSR